MNATSNSKPDRPGLPSGASSAEPNESTNAESTNSDSTNSVPTNDAMIEALFGTSLSAINDDLDQRVEIHANQGYWQTTRISGLSICVLEYVGGDQPRMTALLKLGHNTKLDGTTESEKAANNAASEGVRIPAIDLELLVQHGLVADDDTEYLHPFYIRQPTDRNGNNQNFTLHSGSKNKQAEQHQIEFYIATGQLAQTDKQRRCINLNDHSLWLPGPVDNTEVMPLHMHEGNNSMLVRWLDTASFKPRLDPLGEEVLVISGMLKDNNGSYSTGSWIRNPVSAWQAWSGEAGTLIYYKNGHFNR